MRPAQRSAASESGMLAGRGESAGFGAGHRLLAALDAEGSASKQY
jgi:hypothetical protein